MRDYHRFDFAANFPKKTKWGERTWSISILNVYNRKNSYYYYYEQESTGASWVNGTLTPKYGELRLYQRSLFGILPSISYSFKFYKMREIVLISSFVFLHAHFVKAQIHTGIGGKVSVPTTNELPIDFGGIGFNITAGYLFKEKLDFTISGENIWYHSYLKGLKISSLQANVRYMIIKKPFKPYIGFGGGVFQISYIFWFDGSKLKQSGFGYIPSIGALFDLGLIKGLFINPEFSYYHVQTFNKVNPINFNIGLSYYFQSKKSD